MKILSRPNWQLSPFWIGPNWKPSDSPDSSEPAPAGSSACRFDGPGGGVEGIFTRVKTEKMVRKIVKQLVKKSGLRREQTAWFKPFLLFAAHKAAKSQQEHGIPWFATAVKLEVVAPHCALIFHRRVPSCSREREPCFQTGPIDILSGGSSLLHQNCLQVI